MSQKANRQLMPMRKPEKQRTTDYTDITYPKKQIETTKRLTPALWRGKTERKRSARSPFRPAALRRCFKLSKNQENQPAQLPAKLSNDSPFPALERSRS
jgi:hypothetical protein